MAYLKVIFGSFTSFIKANVIFEFRCQKIEKRKNFEFFFHNLVGGTLFYHPKSIQCLIGLVKPATSTPLSVNFLYESQTRFWSSMLVKKNIMGIFVIGQLLEWRQCLLIVSIMQNFRTLTCLTCLSFKQHYLCCISILIYYLKHFRGAFFSVISLTKLLWPCKPRQKNSEETCVYFETT